MATTVGLANAWLRMGELIASTEHRAVAACWSPEEAAIQRMPAPKGYQCPVCQHSITVHRYHGCDVETCECPQPFGRILPGDSNPTS